MTLWERSQNVTLGCPQDVTFQRPKDVGRGRLQDIGRGRPLVLHKGLYGDVHRTSFGDVLRTFSECNFAEWVAGSFLVRISMRFYNFRLKLTM